MNRRLNQFTRNHVKRLLLVGITVVSLLVVGLVADSGAQDAPPDVNSITPESEPAPSTPGDVSFGEAPEGFVWSVNGELIPVEEVGAGRLPAASGAAAATGSGTKYYLTDDNVASNEALNACAAGYHMASLWEIIDPSNLTYAHDHPDAHTKTDNGAGPPSGWNGRVHTGASASVADSAGSGNCAAWTSVDSGHRGTFVQLTRAWETPPGEIGGIWEAASLSCDLPGPVWCVAEFHALYLPAIQNQ